MNPIAALYLSIKRKESGRLQFVPSEYSGSDEYGVVKVALVNGDIVGFDSTWGSSFDNLKEVLKWRKAVVKKLPINANDHIVRMYIPRREALARIVAFELEDIIPKIRDPEPEEARSLMGVRIGKRLPLSPEKIREIKAGKVGLKSFFLQHDMDHAAIFVSGQEIYSFRLADNRVIRIPFESFPEEGTFMVSVDHLVALTVATPLFTKGRDIGKEEVIPEVKRLKEDPTKLWHIILSGIGGIYVSILGYRGASIGIFVLHGDEIKLKGEKSLRSIVETIDLEGRLYEYGTDMRGA